jgi:hypothetical protein
MQSFAALSMVFVTVLTLVVGTRLVVVARRTRQLPEWLFGLTFLLGGIGSAGAQLGQRLLWNEPGSLASAMNLLCGALVSLGGALLFVVVWRVFRPDSRAAAFASAVGMATLLVSFLIRTADGSLAGARLEGSGLLLLLGGRFVAFSWNAFEAFHYYAQLRRRMALGLADPVASAQILLWGVAAVAMMGTSGLIIGSVFGLGQHPLAIPEVTGAIVLTVCVTSVAMWCAFFPPAPMRRVLEKGIASA